MKILTAAELKKTFVLIQWKSGELHAFTDNGDVTPENLTLQPRSVIMPLHSQSYQIYILHLID